MIYLLLCIFFSASVLVTFKFAERFNINSFSAILINYTAAFIFGFLIAGGNLQPLLSINVGHAIFILLLGAWCVMIFQLLALSVQKAGVAVTTVASKMSVIIPILFSIYIDQNDSLSSIKIVGITLALIAVLLTVYRKNSFKQSRNGFYLPLAIFLGVGLIDASFKFAQVTEGNLLVPVGGMKVTEANIMENEEVLVTLGSREVEGLRSKGVGFLIKASAVFLFDGNEYKTMKEKFPWCRAVLKIEPLTITQTI